MLGGTTKVVHGIVMLRKRRSDSHARGREKPVKPFAQYTSPTVNTPVAMPVFLVDKLGENVTVIGGAR